MHWLRLVQSLFNGLHVGRQEVDERLWVSHLLTHSTCMLKLCVDIAKLSHCARMSARTCEHTPLLLITMTKQTPLSFASSHHSSAYMVTNSSDHRISVGLEIDDHECDDGSQQELWLQRRSANLHKTHKHTAKQTHKLAI